MTILDLLYYSESEITDPDVILSKHAITIGHFCFLARNHKVYVVKHLDYEGSLVRDEVRFHFFKKSPFFWGSLKLYRFIKDIQPDVIMTHGFIFPFEILILRLLKPSQTKIIVQDHMEKPFRNPVKRWLQRMAYSNVDAYMFTSAVMAKPFIDKGIIIEEFKIHEVMEGSTLLAKKEIFVDELSGFDPGGLFLWVGRFNKNKDPLTVLKAFHLYKTKGHKFKLYMIYNSHELEGEVKSFIKENDLEDFVVLKTIVPRQELEVWYNSAGYFISGSHYEGSGIALCEAMACGCVPVVTAIPAFVKITDGGNSAVLYEPGNSQDLFNKLCTLNEDKRIALSKKAMEQFEKELSFEAIAKRTEEILNSLVRK